MSKLYDVRNMFGQDFGITVTNATVSTLNEQIEKTPDRIPKNTLIISSPEALDEYGRGKGYDLGMTSLFATDYNGNMIQLSYAINTVNGLYPNDEGNLQLNIDNKTIIEKDKALSVNTNGLTYCSFNNLGVAKVSKAVSSRTNSVYPIDTFINVDQNGVLFLSDSFLEYLYKYVGNKIYENIYPLILANVKGWLVDKANIKYYPSDRIGILGIDEANGVIITQQYTLQYNSLNGSPDEVNININNNDYPIKEVVFINNVTTVTEDVTSTKEIKIYKHSIDFTVTFYPNYNLQNAVFLDNQYIIQFKPKSFEGNQSLMFYFNQNNAFDKYSNEIFEPFKVSSTTINLNQLRYNKDFNFSFNNQYRYFEDVNYNLEILYLISNNEDNTDDAITLVNKNINDLVSDNYNNILVTLSYNEDLSNNIYNEWKKHLINVDNNTNVITKVPDISSLYKYILRYTINGERTYTYENTFKVNYLLTNIYEKDNFLNLSNDDSITIYSIYTNGNNSDFVNSISGASLNSSEDKQKLNIINESDNIIKIEPKMNGNNYSNEGKEFIYKLFRSLFDKNTLHEKSSNINEKYTTHNILGNVDDEGKYNNEVGFLLVFKCNYPKDIYITNGGESNNQQEYTIFNAITNATNAYGEYIDEGGKEIIIHTDENISLPTHSQYHTLVYPNPANIRSNRNVLQILSFIKLDSFMLQNSSNRTHSLKTNKLWHNFNVVNAQGPECHIKFGFDYGLFFNDHIKLFNIDYGHWPNQFRPGKGKFEFNEQADLHEINVPEYFNSRFYVGINRKLIDDVIDFDTISIEWTFYARKDDDDINNITPITIKATKNNAFRKEDNEKYQNQYSFAANNGDDEYYDIFEINYINEWYTINSNNQIQYNYQMVSWDKYLHIKYKWQKQQTEDYNTFDYLINFNFKENLRDPDIVTKL